MFDEDGNGDVKTQELERLMSLMGINPTKRELSQMAKDVDKSGEYKPAMPVNSILWKHISFSKRHLTKITTTVINGLAF